MSITNCQCAVVAIAKDEAPYIHEWVHHYLYFKFSKLFVAVNRTSDKTQDVLDVLSTRNNNLFTFNVDWIDKANFASPHPGIQALSYSFLTQEIVNNHPEITDVLYVDIDEFWYPSNFKAPIWRWLSRFGKYDVASFNWMTQSGDETPFEKPFANLNVSPHKTVKSIVNLASLDKIKAFRCHVPMLTEDAVHTNHKGKPSKKVGRQNNQQIPGDLDSGAFILHRTMRSEPEYLSLLQKENPEGGAPIKDNRFGFHRDFSYTLNIPEAETKRYHQSLERFVELNGLTETLVESRREVESLANSILKQPESVLFTYFSVYARVLEGTPYLRMLLDIIQHSNLATFRTEDMQQEERNALKTSYAFVQKNHESLKKIFSILCED